jgi:hypothetical protein
MEYVIERLGYYCGFICGHIQGRWQELTELYRSFRLGTH